MIAVKVWIGAKKEGDSIKWISDNTPLGYSPSSYVRYNILEILQTILGT